MKRALVWVMLAWVAVTSTWLALKMSPTADEGIHVESAVLALTRHDFRLDPEHPPLFKYLTAIPVLMARPHLPADDAKLWAASEPPYYDSWREAREYMNQWLYTSGNDPQTLIFLARIPAILCLIGLNLALFLMVKKWYGEKLALWSLFFTAFNPTLLAHGSLANTDVPVALALLLLLGVLHRWSEKPTLGRSLAVSALVAVCFLTKFSGIVAVPVALIWMVMVARKQKLSWKVVGTQVLAGIGLMYVIIWTAYLFHTRIPSSPYVPYPVDISVPVWIHHILPFDFLKGLGLVTGGSAIGRATYLLGVMHPTGVWYYFPIMFMLKTPLVGVLLILGSIFLIKRKQWSTQTQLLVLFSVLFGALSIKSKLNLGIRHISPLLPLASIAMGVAAMKLVEKRRQFFTYALAGLYLLPVVAQIQSPLGFTNILAGSPTNSWQSVESNGDWGQETGDIARKGYTKVYANYLWDARALKAYGVEAIPFDPKHLPTDGVIMVGSIQLTSDDAYAQFCEMTPFDHISNNTFFYHFDAAYQFLGC